MAPQLSQKTENDFHAMDDVDMHRSFSNFDDNFSKLISSTSAHFWLEKFDIKLVSIEKTPGIFWKGNNYFVSQANVAENADCFLRLSETACKLFFEICLGSNNNAKFKLETITELEADLLSKFNNLIFEKIQTNFHSKQKIQKLALSENIFEKILHLGFLIYRNDLNDLESGKIIISIPENIININEIDLLHDNIDITQFNKAKTDVDIFVGYSKISLEELKNLDCEDIIVLDQSNIHQMSVMGDYEFNFKINPNPRLVNKMDLDTEGGDEKVNQELENETNMWDNIQIEVGAEFKKIKLSLGELRQMSEGLVVDIASVYENDLTLTVENKPVAKGELIIIGDKYGVRLTQIIQANKPSVNVQQEESYDEDDFEDEQTENNQKEINEEEDDDFDLNDFEIEEDDI